METNKQLDFLNDFLEDGEQVTAAPKPLTLEEQVVKKYKTGMTLKAITTEHGLSYGKVYEILTRLNVPLRHGRYNASKSGDRLLTMSSFEKASLIADYHAGLSVSELLEKYQINKHGFYGILDAHKVPRRHKHNTLGVDIERVANTHAKAMTQIINVVPKDEPVKVYFEGETLKVLIKKSAFKKGTSELRLEFEFDTLFGTTNLKEEK